MRHKLADFQITDKSLIASVDGAADSLLIYDSSASALKRTTRNVLLDLASAPLGTTDAQSPTNKTFDNSNIFTIRDDRLTFQDNADTTKQLRFQLSSITTGTIRTITFPDVTDIIVTESATQGLANKTLQSPTINTPTIVNPTIQTDSVAEYTAANGVTVDGLNIKDGKLNTNNSVVTANVTDSAITPAKLQSGTGAGWATSTYAPTWTNLTVGNGTLVSKYVQMGKFVHFYGSLTFGSTSAISGAVSLTLPATASSNYLANASTIGTMNAIDAGTASYIGFARIAGTTASMELQVVGTASTYGSTTNMSSTVPFTWGTADILLWDVRYEVA